MLAAFFFQLLVIVDRTDEVFDVVDEALAIGEAAQQERFSAMRTFRFAFLYPGA